MPVILHWNDIALRLALTVLAGLLIGFNRGEHGRPAGMRTTLLVALAASLSMIQANLLMPTLGKASNSFVVLDLMRLPLGILSGMGFIGAGAIIRRGNLVMGVTTAATLWFVTVLGLCFGGGQIGLGLAALMISLIVLEGLKWVEQYMRQEHRATLILSLAPDGPNEDDLRQNLRSAGYRLGSCHVAYVRQGEVRGLRCDVRWQARRVDTRSPVFLKGLAQQPGILSLRWKPQG